MQKSEAPESLSLVQKEDMHPDDDDEALDHVPGLKRHDSEYVHGSPLNRAESMLSSSDAGSPTHPMPETHNNNVNGGTDLRGFYLSTGSLPVVKQSGVRGFFSRYGHIVKIAILFFILLLAVTTIMIYEEGHEESFMFVLKSHEKKFVGISPDLKCDYLYITFRGPLVAILPRETAETHQNQSKGVEARLCSVPSNLSSEAMVERCEASFRTNVVFFITHSEKDHEVKELTHRFEILHEEVKDGHELHVRAESTLDEDIAIDMSLLDIGKYGEIEVYVAFAILLFLYSMIVTEMVHRTVAALIAAVVAIAALNFFKEGPTLDKIIDWIDWETLFLLFGMMLMVTIFAESGFFDFCAILCCKLAAGRKWVLIFVLCFVAGIISAFLDNVTTVLLMTPVVIKICEAHNYDPIAILIAIVLMSNVGGAGTGIGDPPNVLIVNHDHMKEIGINFLEFTTHMSGAAAFCFVVGMGVLYLLYRKKDFSHQSSPECQKLQHKIAMWQKYSNRIPTVSREETHIKTMINKHISLLQTSLDQKLQMNKENQSGDWRSEIKKLESSSGVKDFPLMIKSIVILVLVVVLFFIQSAPFIHADLGFIAFTGSLMLMVLANEDDIETLIEKIEWTTLLFFGSLFVLMESLAELHLLDFIGDRTVSMIEQVDASIRFPVALLVVLWVSALSSSFVDNIPFTQAMIPIVYRLGESDENLHVHPLIWALALGACLGGNGTLIGASANLVCAATAQQKGYKITFNTFFKTGFPFMLATTAAASVYLIFFHVYPFQWNFLSN
ncbi:P protein-like isoform X2 [Symsagittifera roscoffensis]|uniref:P protein-like isoform X2 n=1 Tax=Symsagittifera roscoffensis TaxID=84072 RepID=UPI00307C5276